MTSEIIEGKYVSTHGTEATAGRLSDINSNVRETFSFFFFLHSFRRHSATGKQRERIDNLGINTREGENLATRFPFRPSRYSIYVRKNPRIVAAERFLFFFLSFLFFFLIQSIYAFSRSKFNLRADPWPRVLNTENR